MNNIYYSPETFGLETVHVADDPEAYYSFDMFVIWRDVETGALFYGQDSGCSCPTPFEYVGRDELAELTSDTLGEFFEAVDAWLYYQTDDETAMERHELKRAAHKLLDSSQEVSR